MILQRMYCGKISGKTMKYRIEFTKLATKDYNKLDGSIRKEVNKKLAALKINPFLGEKLGNKQGYNLSSCYKLYVYSKTYRIIYRLISPTHIEVIEIVGIGRRDKGEIYQNILNRILKTDID